MCLPEQLAMRPKPRQAERIRVGLAAGQHQVGFDVAVAIAGPLPAQVMVAVAWRQRHVVGQGSEHRHQVGIKRGPVPALGLGAGGPV